MNLTFTDIDEYPVPTDPDEIKSKLQRTPALDENDEPPHPDAIHEEYVHTIAEHESWKAFRLQYPFGSNTAVYLWNRASSDGIRIEGSEGRWHDLVNLFAAIVDEEGDCRDADYSSSLMPSGSHTQQCDSCGGKWSV